jgi:hypothetical protein
MESKNTQCTRLFIEGLFDFFVQYILHIVGTFEEVVAVCSEERGFGKSTDFLSAQFLPFLTHKECKLRELNTQIFEFSQLLLDFGFLCIQCWEIRQIMHSLFADHIHRLAILIVFEDFFGRGKSTNLAFVTLGVFTRNRKPCRYIGIDTRISEAVVEVMGEVPGGREGHKD